MKKAAIINFKGGVGKTTLSFHLACFLAKEHRVLLVDIDHQSSLSVVTMGEAWGNVASSGATANRIFESFTNRKIEMPGAEIVVPSVMHGRHPWQKRYESLDFVPAQFELDDTEIDLASTNYGNASLSDWEKRTLLSVWLDKIDAKKRYDYVLFDCPPATKIVSQNALAASHCYIVPVIPDELSSRGVTHFAGLVKRKIDQKLKFLRQSSNLTKDQIPSNFVAKTNMAAIAPSIVKSSGGAASGIVNIHTEQLAVLRDQWGDAVLDTVGKNYIAIPEAVNSGWPVWDYWGQNARRSVKNMMRDVCQELKNKIDAS